MIFTDYQRANASPKANRESNFAFLDRSARPEMERVRHYLESLVGEYPQEERAELVARLKCGNDTHFKSAVFELALYAFLVRLGYTLSPHPELPSGSKARPDFHVTTPAGEEFYLEAVLASIRDESVPAAEAMIGSTLDALGKASHPNFMVLVEYHGTPDTQPSGNKLLAATFKWLNSLDPDSVRAEAESRGLGSTPTHEWTHEGWQVRLRAYPLKPEARGKSRTLVGMLDGGAGLIDQWSPIRDAIKFKGAKYGDLDKPLLVAVNFGSFHLDKIDEMDALYGREQYVLDTRDPEEEARITRASNGAWIGPSGPRARRVSGAWIFNDLTVYSLSSRHHTIYLNPWATHPLPEALKAMPHAIVSEDRLQRYDGFSLAEVLGLPTCWPEDG
mgnify:FL=1